MQDTVFRMNCEAAVEIARQIRLRDLGGIIIIDFIDMESPEHQQQVVDALRDALKRDRNKTNVVGLTGLGLVEMTRKKMRSKLSERMEKTCPCCGGTGRVMQEEHTARRALARRGEDSFFRRKGRHRAFGQRRGTGLRAAAGAGRDLSEAR